MFAGAMLAAPACKKSTDTASTTPDNTADTATPTTGDPTTDPGMADPCAGEAAADPCAGAADPCADPCADRWDEGEEGGVGRGFVLS